MTDLEEFSLLTIVSDGASKLVGRKGMSDLKLL